MVYRRHQDWEVVVFVRGQWMERRAMRCMWRLQDIVTLIKESVKIFYYVVGDVEKRTIQIECPTLACTD